MSRKRRKRMNTKIHEKKQAFRVHKSKWWKLIIVFCLLSIAIGFFIYNRVVAFLHSDEFRKDVSAQVSAGLGSVGEFGNFEWDGLSGRNEGFVSLGNGAINKIDASDISLDVNIDYLKRDKFVLKNVRVGQIDSVFDLRRDFIRFKIKEKEKGFIQSFLPDKVELRDAEVSDLNATIYTDSGQYGVSGVNVITKKSEDKYVAGIRGGLVDLPFSFLNQARVVEGEIVKLDDEIYIKNTKFRIFKSGTVTVNGDIDLSPKARNLYNFRGELEGLRCKDVFPEQWHRHLTGEVLGNFKIKSYEGNKSKIAGRLEIENGTLEALPILEKVSYYLAEPKYRTLQFEKFECDFEKQGDMINIRNIFLVNEELLRIEGNLLINGRGLDGVFNLGVPASYLANIPGAKNRVFRSGKDGMLWTSVNIGGDFDNITEDLSGRLIKAATNEMIERALAMGGEVISPEMVSQLVEGGKETVDNIGKMLKGDKGAIEGGVNTAKGILDSLTGSDEKADADRKQSEDKNQKEEVEKNRGIEDKIIPELPGIPKIPKIPLPFL